MEKSRLPHPYVHGKSASIHIAIVIVNYETSDFIQRCLETLAWQRDVSFTIAIADNPSPREDWKNLPTEGITLVRLPANVGYGLACNAAADAVPEATHICILNPDTALPPGSLKPWLGAYEALRKQTALSGPLCVAPRLWNDNGTVQLSRYRFLNAWSYWHHASLIGGTIKSLLKGAIGENRYNKGNLITPEKVQTVNPLLVPDPAATALKTDWVMGAAMLFDRASWDQLGGFSPKFFMYSEDADICYRAEKLGGRTYYLPGLAIFHTQGEPSPENRGKRLIMLFDGFLTLAAQNYTPLQLHLLLLVVLLDLSVRIALFGALRLVRPRDTLNSSRLEGSIGAFKLALRYLTGARRDQSQKL